MENRSDNNVQISHAEEDKKYRKKRFRCRLTLIIGLITVVIVPSTCFGSEEFSKPLNKLEDEYENVQKLGEVTEKLSKRLPCTVSSLQDTKQISAGADDPANLVEKMEFENRIRKLERDMSDLINTNNKKLNVLKSMVYKLTYDVLKMRKERKKFQTNMKTLEEKLSKQSHFMKKNNTRVAKQMSQHDSLNASVENPASNPNIRNMSVETLASNPNILNISVETLGSNPNILNMSVENLGSNLNILNMSVGNLGSNLNILNMSVENLGNNLNILNMSVGNLGSNLNILNMSVENLGNNLNIMNMSVENNGGTLRSFNVTVENIRTTLNDLNASVGNHGSTISSLNASVENIHITLSCLNDSVETHDNTLSSLNTSVESHGRNLNILNMSVENLGSNLNILNMSLESLGRNLNILNMSVENHDSTLSSLNASVESHGRNLSSLYAIVNSNGNTLSSFHASVETHDNTLSSLNVSLAILGSTLSSLNLSVENRITATEHDMLGQINANKKDIEALKDEVRKLNASLAAHVKTLEVKLGEQSETAESRNAQLMKQISHHNETLNGLHVSVGNIGITLNDLNVSVETLACNIIGLNASLDILHSHMKHLIENMTGISIETVVLDKRTEVIEDNIFDKVSLTFVIMINTTLLVVVIIYLVANRKNVTINLSGGVYGDQTQVKPNPTPYSTAGRILSQVGAFPRLERKLCVVSFYEETHPMHMNITQSVTQELKLEVAEFTIRRHEDILELPPVYLYFLFVDFNERNVILEDPTLGLGDLRLTTVHAIQKMGGRLIVFYVRDPNSRQLKPMHLYNKHLASVTRQQELLDLNRLSRFISAYDKLTDYQKEHLRHTVVQELNVR